ncbi:hypothetical protein Daus18300_006452 [Diaporthe australafricana]|uniref:N-acetyltransferase domain-containing protein n=1 Tax=Diaporthe australafricana TaxID=127596 RepID=A0ABR3WUH7_9PEZI
MATAFIRPYKTSDFADTAHICRATLPPTLAASEPAVRIAPYIWTHQYTLLSPATCFVLDDGSGAAVGYVIGCADVFALAAAYPRYVDEVLLPAAAREGGGGGAAAGGDVPVPGQLERLKPWLVPDGGGGVVGRVINEACLAQMAHSPRWLPLEGVEGKEELVRRFRATMHIDLLEGWRGKGWGREMITVFMASVRDAVEAGGGGLDCGRGVHIGVAGENKKVVPFYERVGFRVYEGGEREGGNVWMVSELS